MNDCDCGIDHGDTHFLAHGGPLRIFCTTFPKSGTNIIGQFWGIEGVAPAFIAENGDALEKLQAFLGPAYGHLPYKDKYAKALAGTPIYVLIRDPRDNAISQLYHARKWPDTPLNFVCENGATLIENIDPIMRIIESLPERWALYLPWLKTPGVMTIRYEGLICDRRAIVERMIAHAGPELVSNIGLGSADDWLIRFNPSTSRTFRKGIPGAWFAEFNKHHHEAFDRIMGETMEVLGYE